MCNPNNILQVFFKVIFLCSRHFLLFKEPEGSSQTPIIGFLFKLAKSISHFHLHLFEDAKQRKLSHFIPLNLHGEQRVNSSWS